jgi:hypothetical protein
MLSTYYGLKGILIFISAPTTLERSVMYFKYYSDKISKQCIFQNNFKKIMRKRTPEKTIIIACIVIVLGAWYISQMKGCDCIKAEQIIPILATGFAIGILVTNIKAWLIKRKQENEL